VDKVLTPKVSVVIPVYNTAPYLRRCLDSVCNQTLWDIEIICIDDASTDNSLEILREYEHKDFRVKLIDFPDNKGTGTARNAGIDTARGEYIGFVDSDDEVEIDFYGKLYQKADITDADIIKGELRCIDYNGTERKILRNDKVREDKLFFWDCFSSALYKSRFIHEKKIRFPAGIILGQDIVFLTKAVLRAGKVETVNNVFYVYHRREDSANGKILNKAKVLGAIKSYELIFDELNAAYDMAIVKDAVYIDIFVYRLRTINAISWQANEGESKYICAEAMVRFFNQCRLLNMLSARLSSDCFGLYKALRSGTISNVADFLVKADTPASWFLTNVRARLSGSEQSNEKMAGKFGNVMTILEKGKHST
jgi:glycosyltransferase involved in cell wall biosynthesis